MCTYAGHETLPADSPYCVEPPPPPPPPPPRAAISDSITVVRVHYGTDRKLQINDGQYGFGAARGKLSYGILHVSIPPGHDKGELEGPRSLFGVELSTYDPNKHVVLRRVAPLPRDYMFRSLRATVDSAAGKEVFVFVHGFNVTFEDAARRTAQIAYDLNLKVVPVLYSWPSRGGRWGIPAYKADDRAAMYTVPHLQSFLEEVARTSGATKIHILAHSMGGWATTQALARIAAPGRRALFQSVILAAPDIDRDIFLEQIAPAVLRSARRVTIYASSNDRAMLLSQRVNNADPLGLAGRALTVMPGFETVDASKAKGDWLGHAYVAGNKQVLDDVFYATVGDQPADKRNLQPGRLGKRRYWLLR